MRSVLTALVIPVLVVWACATGGERSEPVDDGMVAPSGAQPGGPTSRSGQVLSGRLGFDEVEGGCAYVERDDGTRFEVLFPAGWHVDRAAGALVGPEGERVSAADRLSVRGSIATDRSSICQLGPIFEASEVLTGR